MPINAELFDGTILEFPDNTDPSVIRATAARITEEKQIKQNTSNLGDIATAFKQGVVGAGKSLTDVAGADNAASQYLGGIQERLGKQYRPQRIEEMQKRQQIIDEAVKSGSTLEEIKAYLGGVTEAPVQSIAQAVGSFAPYVAAGALGAGARAASLAVPSARAVNTGIGALQGTGAVKGSIYENVKRELEAQGESPEVAAERALQAQAYSSENAPQLGLGAVLGAAAGRYGAESLVTPGVATRLNARMLPRAAMAAASEAPFEGLQAGQEQYATNLALAREGIDRDPMQGVIGSAARDAAIGAITAAPIGAISRGQTAPSKPVLEPTKAQEKEELAKQSDPSIYNDEVKQSAPQIAAMLLPEMKRFGLENVGLKVMDSIENGRADGMWANNLIHVALDKPNPMGSMRHESIHALRELGGFKDNEWSALNNKAKGEWLQTFIKDTGKYDQYKKIYQKDNKTLAGFDNYIQEEAIAEAFRYFDKNGAPEGMIGAIYEKLKLMFEAIRNGFTGAGFQSADSIFRSIESGTRAQVAPAGEVLNPARFSQPDTRRIDMNFKDVTKRVPELTEAAKKVEAGEMTAAQYDKLVNRYKPIVAYDFVPEPTPRALAEEGLAASDEKKIARYGKTEQIPKGHPVGLRLDIPAYTKKGAWVNTIHNEAKGDQKDSMPYSSMYSNVSAVKNATFEVPQRMIKVATGEQNKYPDARIMGNWQPINEKQAVSQAKKALNDPAWTQVGMDPERHGYFYDRKTTQPILSADEVIQIGPLVLAKNAKFGSKKDFKYSLGEEDGTKGFLGKVPKGKAGKNAAETRRLSGQGELPRITELLPSTGRFLTETEDLRNVPPAMAKVNVPTVGDYDFGANPVARQAAANYMADKSYRPATQYMPVNEERAKRIAQAYEDMKDDPSNPRVKASYEAMARETLAQYAEIKKTGLQVEFISEDMDDPYKFSPRLAIIDVNNNNHLWVFPTDFGYGESGALDDPNNPMLAYTDEVISGKKARVNDIFRIVHDYFGHIKDGVGFRAGGEENAWRSHVEMYSPLARLAMTTETRGQNSWVNFGPEAKFNKTASGVDTKYAPQKLGLLPDEFVYSGAPSETDYNPSTLIINGLFNPDLKGKPTVDLVGAYFDSLHKKPDGTPDPLDYKDPDTFRMMVQFASEEIQDQLKQEKSGLDWYEQDIKTAFDDTIKVIPELAKVENRQLFNVIAGIQSPATTAKENWVIAAEAFKHFVDTGTIPQINPKNGQLWMGGLTSANKKKQLNLLNNIVQAMGKDKAIEWMYESHPISEINDVRAKYGGLGKLSGGGKKDDMIRGLFAFGPKVGPFVSNLNGIHDVTVDKWMTRTFKRYIGNMTDKAGKIIDAPTEQERAVIKQFINEVAKNEGIKPYQAQSILWFYEQRLFRSLGTPSPSYGFSDGARKFLEQNTKGGDGSSGQDVRGGTEADQEQKIDRKLSIVAPNTQEFKQWFGESKIVNSDGEPKVYYHGTAQDITEFRPKQAGAIFLTDNPKFAGSFSDLSKSYMERDAFQSASPTEQIYQLKTVKRLLEEEGRDTDSITKDIKTLTSGRKLSSDFYLDGGYSDLLDYVNRDTSGAQNILPVFVKSNNPFDYQNSENVNKLLKTLNETEMKDLLPYVSFDPNRLKKRIQEGSWSLIERKEFQSALKRAGFDGFYVSEGGNKNLAVYDSSQIKSFTNQAPTESKDIRFSVALDSIAPDTFLTSDKNPNALGNLGFMPTNSPFPKRPIRLPVGIREDYVPEGDNKVVKAYGAKHILFRALKDVGHRPEEVTKEALEDTILHIESLAKRFNRVYEDRGSFVLYDSQSDDLMIVSPISDKVGGDYYGVTTMYSNPNAPRKYGNPKWTGKNIQPPVKETGLKAQGLSVMADEEGNIIPTPVPRAYKGKAITPNQIDEQAQNLPRKTGTLGVKKKLSIYSPEAEEAKKQIMDGAKAIANMNPDKRDNISPYDHKEGVNAYKWYEANKEVPKPSDKLKKLNWRTSDTLEQSYEWLANVDGNIFALNKREDPDYDPYGTREDEGEEDEEAVKLGKWNYAYENLLDVLIEDQMRRNGVDKSKRPTIEEKQTWHFDKKELFKDMRESLKTPAKLSLATNAPPQGTFTTVLPNETAGKRLTDTITNVINFFKDPEKRMEARIAFIDPNSALAKRLENQPIYDTNGVLRADLLARGRASTINVIRNGLQTGIPIKNSDGSVIIQRDDVNNLANSQALADRLNDNQYVIDSEIKGGGRGFVAEVARALRAKEIMAEDAAYNKTEPNRKKHKNREKQIKIEQIKWAEQQLKNVPELQDIFDIWKNVNTGLINLWEDVGLFSKKQADKYRSKKYYVSLAASNADLEIMMANQLGFTASGLKSTGKVHELKGAEYLRDKNGVIQTDENGKPILLERNIWENIDKQYASMLAAAYQNQVRKVAIEQLMNAGNGSASIPSRMKNGKLVGAPLTKGINLKYKDYSNQLADKDGVVHAIVTNPIDLAAFETFHYELTPLMKFFGGATNVLRATALINPMFWIRQLIRDPIHAALVANSGITTPFHSAKEFINILANNSPEARILAERGVIGQYDSTLDLQSYLEQSGKEQMPKGNLSKMFHKLMQMHEASDASTRVAIFKKEKQAGLDKGMTEEQAVNFAVMKARESINFMVHGNSETLNALRQMIPFLSASITSLDTVYRAATGYNLPPAEKAAAQKLFKQRAALMFGASVAYAMLMQDDEEYKKLPNYIKDNNWLIKNPLGEGFIKVAVPYEVGFLFKTLPEVAIRGLAGNATGKEMLKSYKDGFLHNMPTGGVPVPQAVKPALEVITNYSFFTGNPIESIGEGRLPVEMRGRNASETAKFLSQAGLGAIGLSPAKIDALVQGYMAEAGTFTFTLADHLVTTMQGKEPTSKNLAKQPFFKAFLTDPNSNKAVADFYQISQTANQVAQEFSDMTKSGLGAQAVELMQDEDKRKLMASAPALRRVATSMTAIRKAIEATNNNQNIPPDERREMVNKLTAQYNRVAEQGVKLADTLGIR